MKAKKMDWKIYELMSNIFIQEEDNEYIFAHISKSCEWNTMLFDENQEDCLQNMVFGSNMHLFTFLKDQGQSINLGYGVT